MCDTILAIQAIQEGTGGPERAQMQSSLKVRNPTIQ